MGEKEKPTAICKGFTAVKTISFIIHIVIDWKSFLMVLTFMNELHSPRELRIPGLIGRGRIYWKDSRSIDRKSLYDRIIAVGSAAKDTMLSRAFKS